MNTEQTQNEKKQLEKAIDILSLLVDPVELVQQLQDLENIIKLDQIYPSIDSPNISSIGKLTNHDSFNPSDLNILSITDVGNQKEDNKIEKYKSEILTNGSKKATQAFTKLKNRKIYLKKRKHNIYPVKTFINNKKYKELFETIKNKNKSDPMQLLYRSFKVPKKRLLKGALGQNIIEGDEELIGNVHTALMPHKTEQKFERIEKNRKKKIKKIEKINRIVKEGRHRDAK